ncbi:MAG TPA: dihydrodipicolinate synthase family protein [Candidatus Binatia bacterium]|nr:dihydrodipicolinate synthase family protein [Candidatus Binatia bacterium]
MSERIRGVLAPVVTPFKADLAPDSKRFIAHCKWLLSQNCGLAVFGTNSEANSLSMEERLNLLDELVAARVDPSRMMPGTGCCSIMETVKLTKQAVGHGCAGVLMLPPFYYKDVSEEGLYRYFSEVVQRVGDRRLKIYLYHIPAVAVVGITPKLVERLLAAYPDAIAGMKDSSGDWNNTKTFLDAFVRARQETSSKSQTPSSKSQGSSKIQHPKDEGTFRARRDSDIQETSSKSQTSSSKSQGSSKIQHPKDEGTFGARTFDVFIGSESFLLANMRNGGAGTISATANVNPAAIYELYVACTEESKSDPPSSGSGRTTARPAFAPLRRGRLDLEGQQAKLNVVRAVFSGRKFPSMIAALKQAIAIYADDPAWRTVRPPLVEFTPEQAGTLAAELKAISFTMPGIEKCNK